MVHSKQSVQYRYSLNHFNSSSIAFTWRAQLFLSVLDHSCFLSITSHRKVKLRNVKWIDYVFIESFHLSSYRFGFSWIVSTCTVKSFLFRLDGFCFVSINSQTNVESLVNIMNHFTFSRFISQTVTQFHYLCIFCGNGRPYHTLWP